MLGVLGRYRAHRGAHGVHGVAIHARVVRPSVPGGLLGLRDVPALRHDSRRRPDPAAAQGRPRHGGVLDGGDLRPHDANGARGADGDPADGTAQGTLVQQAPAPAGFSEHVKGVEGVDDDRDGDTGGGSSDSSCSSASHCVVVGDASGHP